MPFLPQTIILLLGSLLAQTAAEIKPVATTIEGRNVDSLAVWVAPKREDSLVLLTEKGGGQVMVFKADARATFVTRFGEMKRPNGVVVLQGARIGAVKSDLAFITDRDANIVHVYSVPDFRPLGTFGQDLKQPMGIALHRRQKDGAVFAYVVAKRAEGDGKVARYRIAEAQGRLTGRRELSFGRELTVGQETVAVDGEKGRVFVADENARDVKVYDLDGKYQSSFGGGVFEAQVEGIVVAACGAGGYLVASDQKDVTEFEVFDRATFKHLGTLRGAAMRTDGVALTLAPLPDFPRGLFAAQSDPADTGGRHAEFYDFGQMLDRLKLGGDGCFTARAAAGHNAGRPADSPGGQRRRGR
jgi:3-phytase